jgi:methionine-rich copper-binding protein CopC
MLQTVWFRIPTLLLALALGVVPAFAHSRPKTMTPAAGSVVSSPAELSVYFTEALEPKFSSLQLKDTKGAVVSKAASVVDSSNPTHLELALPKLAPGVYYVHWVSVATDGHRLDGDYSFTVK